VDAGNRKNVISGDVFFNRIINQATIARKLIVITICSRLKKFFYELRDLIKLHKLKHKRITSIFFVGFEVLTAVIMRNSIFWDVTPFSPLKVNRRFG
jgi:hypothetical protein